MNRISTKFRHILISRLKDIVAHLPPPPLCPYAKSQHKPNLASSLSKDAWYGNSKHSGAKLSFRLHLRIFYISFHFLTQLARYTSIVDQEILLKFSFDAKRQIMTSQRAYVTK